MSPKFTHIAMRILAAITGLFAVARLYFQLFIVKDDPSATYLWIITVAIFVPTFGFWKQYKWSVYLYILGFLANNIKAAIEGTWMLSSQLMIAVITLTVHGLNFIKFEMKGLSTKWRAFSLFGVTRDLKASF